MGRFQSPDLPLALGGDRLKQYNSKGDVQFLQVLGDHVYVGHHGEFFGSK